MTAVDTAGVHRTAAGAALAIPGVVELHPTLRQSLAGAATRIQQALGSPAAPLETPLGTGIRAEHTPTGAWHVEVRCVLDEDRRVLDTARDVREHVRSAVGAHLARQGTPGPVTVVVTVTRLTSRGRSLTA